MAHRMNREERIASIKKKFGNVRAIVIDDYGYQDPDELEKVICLQCVDLNKLKKQEAKDPIDHFYGHGLIIFPEDVEQCYFGCESDEEYYLSGVTPPQPLYEYRCQVCDRPIVDEVLAKRIIEAYRKRTKESIKERIQETRTTLNTLFRTWEKKQRRLMKIEKRIEGLRRDSNVKEATTG